MESVWHSEKERSKRGKIRGFRKVETVVIGAGMAGVLIAYLLQKNGHEVIVLEAKEIGSGQTENTTAKITCQHGACYDRMIMKMGPDRAREYVKANREAITMFERIIKQENINCHFERCSSYLYATSERGLRLLEHETEAADYLSIDAHFVSGEKIKELPFQVKGALCFENQACFHPMEFLTALAKGLEIYEDSQVNQVEGNLVFTDKADIEAEHIVFATHYPIENLPGFYFLRQHQERSYVLALKSKSPLSGMYYSVEEDGLSFRSFQELLLLGGGGHRTGKEKENMGYTYLKKAAKKYYPEAEIESMWSAQDCMPHDEIPFIGKYSIFRPDWYVATGFHKWGMTSSMIAAQIIAGKICGKPVSYEKVFSPQRFCFRASLKNLSIDLWESACGLGKGLFSKKGRRCTHMGCRLEWNMEERRWECPCHGSGFSDEGELTDNPAATDLRGS